LQNMGGGGVASAEGTIFLGGMGECSPRIVIMPVTTIKVKLAEYFILRSITTIKVKLADLVLRWSFRQSDWLCNLSVI
jgi:hypothetical protein